MGIGNKYLEHSQYGLGSFLSLKKSLVTVQDGCLLFLSSLTELIFYVGCLAVLFVCFLVIGLPIITLEWGEQCFRAISKQTQATSPQLDLIEKNFFDLHGR